MNHSLTHKSDTNAAFIVWQMKEQTRSSVWSLLFSQARILYLRMLRYGRLLPVRGSLLSG